MFPVDTLSAPYLEQRFAAEALARKEQEAASATMAAAKAQEQSTYPHQRNTHWATKPSPHSVHLATQRPQMPPRIHSAPAGMFGFLSGFKTPTPAQSALNTPLQSPTITAKGNVQGKEREGLTKEDVERVGF